MNELIPALLAPDEATFHKRVEQLRSEFSVFQIDVMDGAFVPTRSWFNADTVRNMKTPPVFELHLMVMDPASHIQNVLDMPNVSRIIWHIEATANHPSLINACHAQKKEAGLAINPSTPKGVLEALYDDVDEVLIMGAEPGYSGRVLDPRMFGRAKSVHADHPGLILGFDVNVNAETIPALKEAGVTRFCAASSIFDDRDPLAAALRLRELILPAGRQVS